MSNISIIIPVHNDIHSARNLVSYLKRINSTVEIILSFSSKKEYISGVKNAYSPKKGRAEQMNYGATFATKKYLFFLHADSYPPKEFLQEIPKYESGTFQLQFDDSHIITKLVTLRSAINVSGLIFGDRGLFMTRNLFEKIGGFTNDTLLEDAAMVRTLKKQSHFIILPYYTKTSARRYKEVGHFRLQLAYLFMYTAYMLGFSLSIQKKLYSWLCT